MIKAVSFDIGHTLVDYQNPLNWKVLYRPALCEVAQGCAIGITEDRMLAAESVLSRYNTRENPRDYEVTSKMIFGEILDAWDLPYKYLDRASEKFYSFFRLMP